MMATTMVCPSCGSASWLTHMFVLTDHLCVDCGHEWSTATTTPAAPVSPVAHKEGE